MTTQLEHLTPDDIEQALAERSLVFIPLGTIEWHGHHLPVGFDAISAHTICRRVAEQTGGLVYPPLHYGIGGGHGQFPWTIMTDVATLGPLLRTTVQRLADFGLKHIVLFTGHFPDEQLDLIADVARAQTSHGLRVDAYSPISPGTELSIEGDHAGLFETSLMAGLDKAHVHLDRIPEATTTASDRNDHSDPLYGVGGPDPRNMTDEGAAELTRSLVDWIVNQITANPQRAFDDPL